MIARFFQSGSILTALALFGAAATSQQELELDQELFVRPQQPDIMFHEFEDGSILVADWATTEFFETWQEYVRSDFFDRNGMRCVTDKIPTQSTIQRGTTADCSDSNTNTAAEYEPAGGTLYQIPVVFHVLTRRNGAGNVTDALIESQIEILNEDFGAMAGSSNGMPEIGVDARIEFFLATEDPDGNPTNGITRSGNNNWYNDGGSYWNSLAWDTTRYLNIYTNQAGGSLGYAYVPSGGGVVGNTWDRVVLLWSSVGRNSPYGPPYNQGRTGTHEVGHYLGLYHTFSGGCAAGSEPGCWTSGDLICDTNSESSSFFGCGTRTTCGTPDPTDNYMDYTDDLCMNRFTADQANRMRCTLDNFRVDLGGPVTPMLPGKAGSPSPSNGASGVSTSASLSWSAGSGADDYDVYFGTSANPPFVQNQTGTSYTPTLADSTTYYWRIDSVNAQGTTTGDLWSFTTAGPGGGITLSVDGYKVKGKWTTDLTWSGAAGGSVDIYRQGAFLTSTSNDGAYTDATTFKGGGSLTYQVCETGGSPCSNSATANF